MAVFEPPLPWLLKGETMRVASRLIALSAVQARGLVGYLDLAQDGEDVWERPRSRIEPWTADLGEALPSSGRQPYIAFSRLVEHRRAIPSGSFVFMISDFLVLSRKRRWCARSSIAGTSSR